MIASLQYLPAVRKSLKNVLPKEPTKRRDYKIWCENSASSVIEWGSNCDFIYAIDKKVEICIFSENKIEFYTFLKILKFEIFYHFEIL